MLIAAVSLLAVASANGASPPGGAPREHPVWGPALAAQDASLARAAGSVAAAEAALGRADHGVRARLEAHPTLTWTGRPGAEPQATSSLVVTGRVDWIDDPAARAAAALAHHRATSAALETAHRDVRTAVGAYLDLRRALVAVAVADAAVASRRTTFERAERSVVGAAGAGAAGAAVPAGAGPAAAPPGPGDRELELARLELERALDAVERARRDAADAERDAARAGFDVEAARAAHDAILAPDPLEGWRLGLHEAGPSPDVVRRALESDLAAARLGRLGVAALVDEVRLEAGWTGTDSRLRVSVALDEGRPAAFAEASLRSAPRPSWTVTLRARVRLADTWDDDLAAGIGRADEAERALRDAEDEAAYALAALVRAARDAEADVAFAERSLELGRWALEDLVSERDGVAAAARGGESGGEERLARFDEALRRSELGHLRERDAFLRAWDRYLRAAERVAVATGAAFEPVPVQRPARDQDRVPGR